MNCVNHEVTPATYVTWWPHTHWLDVECGICEECAAGDCKDLNLVELGSDEFWRCFDEMRERAT